MEWLEPWRSETLQWPWALALLVVPLVLLWWRGQREGRAAVVFPGLARMRPLGARPAYRVGRLRWLWPLGALACLAVALARPQDVVRESTVVHSGVDVMLVLDATPTMLARDFTLGGRPVSRVEAVVHLAGEFIDARPHDRIGLIYFAAFPSLLSPPTHYHGWLHESLRRVEVRPATAIGDALASAANRLKDSDAASRVVVLLTDGDNNWGRIMPATAAQAAGALGIKVYAIGIGSDQPVLVPGYGRMEAILDEETLRTIAERSGGEYFRAFGADDLREVFRQIDELEKTEFDSDEREFRVERFRPWLLAAGVFLLLGFLSDQGSWRRLW
jgi:Ca-activated chloride channel family protein